MTQDHNRIDGIATRHVTTPFGRIAVYAVREEDEKGEAYATPAIDDLPCTFRGEPAAIVLSISPKLTCNVASRSRSYGLEDCLRIVTPASEGRAVAVASLRDGRVEDVVLPGLDAPAHVVSEREAEAARTIDAACSTDPGFFQRINDAIAAVERDCLVHAAKATRERARALERAAARIEADAERVIPRLF